ncbi:hypothetical protein HA402_014804 [Bradysia odoriphaga]|nr:hypothetical protein HA402_014804 [Bradysia odoriphaga]
MCQLCRLHQHDNVEIFKLLAGFMENPSILNRNEFLHRINTMGHCIESLKPKKIICSKLNIDMDDANHSMWLDFNKTEQTVSFAAVDLADCGSQTFATTHCVKLRESVKDSHLLEINGFWNVISVDTSQSSGQRVTVRVHFVDKTEELISTTVKTVFRFVNPGDVAGSASQGFISDYTEAEPAQDNILPECTPLMTPCLTVLMSLGQSEKKKSFALPTIPRHSIPKFTFTLEFLPNTRRESDESDAERPLQSNLSSVSPTAHSPTSDCKYTPSGTSANRLAGSSFQKSFHQNSVTLTGSPQENSESLKMNKSLNQPDVLPWASGTPETPQKIEETIECNAAIESSSLQASREKSWENLSQNQDAPKRTKCIAIADLPKMSSQFEPVTESEKEPTLSQKASEARRSFTSSQNSTKKPAPSSLQQRIEVPTVDPLAKSSQTNLDASRKRTKSPSSQILSVSAPQHYPNSEELGATVLIVSPLHSSQNQTAMSSQPSIQIVPIIDTSDDMESTLKAKRPKLSAEVAKISTDQKYNARVVLSRISNSQLYRYMLRKRPILNRCTSMYRTMF